MISILVPEQRFRNPTVERDQTRLIVLIAQFIDHDQDFSQLGNNVVVVARHQVWINKRHPAWKQRFWNAPNLVHGIQAQNSTHVRQEIDTIIHVLGFKQKPR